MIWLISIGLTASIQLSRRLWLSILTFHIYCYLLDLEGVNKDYLLNRERFQFADYPIFNVGNQIDRGFFDKFK